MYYLIGVLAYISLSTAVLSVQDDLVQSMQTKLQEFNLPMPTNTLLTTFQTKHSYSLRTASSDSLQRVLSAWNLPSDVQLQMDMAAYATTEEFQTYSFSITGNNNPEQTSYEQYILSAKNVNQTITMAYLYANVQANIIPQYTIVHVHTCHRCWLFARCCSTATEQIKRGLTPSEVETIMTIVQVTAYHLFSTSFPTELFLHYQDIKNIYDSNSTPRF
jgi:hypothetical protein